MNTQQTTPVWFVTGAVRGLGTEIATAALEAGNRVAVAGRNLGALRERFAEYGEAVYPVALDLTKPEQIEAAVGEVADAFGGIDVLVNNAGYGQLGIFEEIDAGAVERQFTTNVLGTMAVTRAVLPLMRRQGAGHVINVSSIGGVASFGGASVYCASKYAVEGFSASLAQEVAPLGIKVTIIEPGYFRTDFLDASSIRWNDRTIDDYQETARSVREYHETVNHNQPGDPRKLGRTVVELAQLGEPPLHFLVGSDAYQLATTEFRNRLTEAQAFEAQTKATDLELVGV